MSVKKKNPNIINIISRPLNYPSEKINSLSFKEFNTLFETNLKVTS